MIPEETEKRLSRIEQAIGLSEGIAEQPADKVQASLVGPLAEVPEAEEERLDINDLLQRMAQMIDARLSDLQGDVYEIIEEYIHNENNINNLRTLIRVTSPKIHKAYCKANAGEAATIVCYLDTAAGEEITVTCTIAGGGTLNAALPLLTDGLPIAVWNDGGTWRCATTFRKADICPLDE